MPHEPQLECATAVIDHAAAVNLDAPEDPVQRTCSGACALRALELLRRPQDAIVRDPLALRMAGASMLQLFGERWDAWEAAEGPGKHSYFAGRARVLDDMVEAAVRKLASSSSAVQVVSLGCGMDTRPWRLSLPPNTPWFDVDQLPVLAIKTKFLRGAGAQLKAGGSGPNSSTHRGDAALAGACSSSSSRSDGSGGGNFPLKCYVYKQVVADLEQADLQHQLEAASFSPHVPTVWVAEGLCYYLSIEANEKLLKSSSAASPPGSVFIATHIPEENLAANRAATNGSHLAGLFTVCMQEVVGGGMYERSGWGQVSMSADIGEVIRSRCGVDVYYPYSLAYSGGVRLSGIECIVEAVRM